MGKNAKEHRKRVAKRNERIKTERQRFEKQRREMIMDLINQEKEKGMFQNNQPVDNLIGSPMIDGPLINGPIIDGPIIDGPVISGPTTETPIGPSI